MVKRIELQCGDRALVKRVGHPISELICWKTNSRFSHVEPIFATDGSSIDATLLYPKLNNVWNYADEGSRIMILRPVPAFTLDQRDAWHRALMVAYDKALQQPLYGYDLTTYFGFAGNKRADDKQRVNCAELCFLPDRAAGLFPLEDGYLISPQSYWDYAVAGAFEVIFQM